MIKDLFTIRLNRAIWVSLLDNEKLTEAVSYFDKYMEELKNLKFKKDSENEISNEIKYSCNLLNEKLTALAEKYYNEKNYTNALLCYNRIFNSNPVNLDNIRKYAKCLEDTKQYDLGISLVNLLIKKENNPENYKNLSKLYEKNNRHETAIKAYKQYIKKSGIKTLSSFDNAQLGCLYFYLYKNNPPEPKNAQIALKYFLTALSLNPKDKLNLKNVINAAILAKKPEIEKKCWQEYIKNGYYTKENDFEYSAFCMRTGDVEGWAQHYEARFFEKMHKYPEMKKPRWLGEENIKDKILLVHSEQGFGDTFLMFGYMERLIKLAKHVIFVSQDEAADLLKNNTLGVEVLAKSEVDLDKLDFDYEIPSMSIPLALKLTRKNISVGGGYLKPKKELVESFKKKYFNNKKYKIGLSFRGSYITPKRNIPSDKLFIADELKDVEFYCLTKDIKDEELSGFKNNKIINAAKDFKNFEDTAAAIENMDIILSSDNGVLNLAGAIGKKTICIFNYFYEFRWYDLTGKDCGWFSSVIPVLNNEYDDWALSMKKAIKLIEKDKEINHQD